MIDTSKDDDRAVAYFELCEQSEMLSLDWDAFVSRAGLNVLALAAVGLPLAARQTVREFISSPTRARLSDLYSALDQTGPSFNARTRKEVKDVVRQHMDARRSH